MKIQSTDGVELEVHDLGGNGSNVLMAHATGFHGRVWEPVAALLAEKHHCYAVDFRGHGDTAAPKDWTVHWNGYGDDAYAAAVAVREPKGIIGVGHSLGGAALFLAAQRDPELFRGIFVYEPIVFSEESWLPAGREENPLAAGARRRKAHFKSYDAAIENFAGKMPMNSFAEESLAAYVHGGFREHADGTVHLKCTPQHEAATFEASTTADIWPGLAGMKIPVWVVSGAVEPFQPSSMAEAIAEELPNGQFVQYSDLDHFGPMVDPARIARMIDTFVDIVEF